MSWSDAGIALALGVFFVGALWLIWKLIAFFKLPLMKWFSVVAFVLGGLIGIAANEFVLPWIEQRRQVGEIEETLARNVGYQALKQYDPPAYRVALAEVVHAARPGRLPLEIWADLAAIDHRVLKTRLPTASNAAAVNYMRAKVGQLKELMALNDDSCYRYWYPKYAKPVDFTIRVAKQTRERVMQGTAEVIRSASLSPQPVPAVGDVADALSQAIAPVTAEFGSEVDTVDQPKEDLASRRKACLINAKFYDALLGLPVDRAGPAVRYLVDAVK